METITVEQLETIRNLIVAGWMLLFLGWCVQLGFDSREARKPKQPSYQLCPLHKRDLKDCPPGSHEPPED